MTLRYRSLIASAAVVLLAAGCSSSPDDAVPSVPELARSEQVDLMAEEWDGMTSDEHAELCSIVSYDDGLFYSRYADALTDEGRDPADVEAIVDAVRDFYVPRCALVDNPE